MADESGVEAMAQEDGRTDRERDEEDAGIIMYERKCNYELSN